MSALRPAIRKRSEYRPLIGATYFNVDKQETNDNMNRMTSHGHNSQSTGMGEGDREHLFDSMNGNPIFHDFGAMLNELSEHEKLYGERLRRHLQFFFMDPMQKFKVRRQFPFKLALQILRVFFVTVQLILFAEMRISHVDFLEDTVTVMRHKFLHDWDHSRDAISYPPESSRYSIFSSTEIIEHMSYIVVSYYSLQNESFASFSYDTSHIQYPMSSGDDSLEGVQSGYIPPIQLCVERIADVKVENQTYIFDITERTDCVTLNFSSQEIRLMKKDPYYIAKAFMERNITFKPEDALTISKADLRFNLRTIHFSPGSMDQLPECYLIKIRIEFDNSRHTGQVFVNLATVISYINLCNGRVLQVVGVGFDVIMVGGIDVIVLVLCLSSLILCCRALFKALVLKSKTSEFFEKVLQQRFEFSDRMEFLNLWYVIIVLNDILIIFGTISKVSIEFRDFDNGLFTLTGILLGIGALLVYFGLLRYLGFFNQYNILIVTMKRSIPPILRFMVCTVILYVGFLLTGWVVLGPYSFKFRTLSGSSEALFSLLNGDDMFVTFSTISDSNTVVKIFGTVYIYLFVTLFIYVVLSLFIAIIMDAYEVVKQRHNQQLVTKKSTLKEFLASSEPPSNLDDEETRGLFSADRLLSLGDSSVLNYCRNIWDNIRMRLRMRQNSQFPYNNYYDPSNDDRDTYNSANNNRQNSSTNDLSLQQLHS